MTRQITGGQTGKLDPEGEREGGGGRQTCHRRQIKISKLNPAQLLLLIGGGNGKASRPQPETSDFFDLRLKENRVHTVQTVT